MLLTESDQYDIGLCAYTSMLRIVAQFHEKVFSDPDNPTGLNEVRSEVMVASSCSHAAATETGLR